MVVASADADVEASVDADVDAIVVAATVVVLVPVTDGVGLVTKRCRFGDGERAIRPRAVHELEMRCTPSPKPEIQATMSLRPCPFGFTKGLR